MALAPRNWRPAVANGMKAPLLELGCLPASQSLCADISGHWHAEASARGLQTGTCHEAALTQLHTAVMDADKDSPDGYGRSRALLATRAITNLTEKP